MNTQNSFIIGSEYTAFLEQIKTKIRSAQIKATWLVNQELIKIYWEIGNDLAQKEKKEGWGAKIIDTLAKDLKEEFPNINGFSKRNLLYMRQFADAYPDFKFTQQAVAQIPWGQNIVLLEKLSDTSQRLWYAQKAQLNGWGRNMLLAWIESNLYAREGKAITNFERTLPQPQSDLAKQLLKDPYCFDFLTLTENAHEKELEQGLIAHVQKFLLELGTGFAFVARQHQIKVEDEEYYADLLFYNYKLKCFIVIELKATAFKPEFVGKMNFYLAAIDDTLKQADDNPSIGMILCKNKKKLTIEYALRNFITPIGIASYETKIAESLPENLKKNLPTIEQFEEELCKGLESNDFEAQLSLTDAVKKKISQKIL